MKRIPMSARGEVSPEKNQSNSDCRRQSGDRLDIRLQKCEGKHHQLRVAAARPSFLKDFQYFFM